MLIPYKNKKYLKPYGLAQVGTIPPYWRGNWRDLAQVTNCLRGTETVLRSLLGSYSQLEGLTIRDWRGNTQVCRTSIPQFAGLLHPRLWNLKHAIRGPLRAQREGSGFSCLHFVDN